MEWLPANTAPFVALALIIISFATSAISAAFGIGGGVAMLITLLSLTPPIVALPVHALVQIGSNAGRATMFLGATGPLLAVFLSPERYGRDRTVATHATCMTLQHLFKVIAFGLLGFVLVEWLPLVIAMIVSGLAGTWIGQHLLRRLPEMIFRKVFKTVLTVLALRLMYKAVFG